MNEAARLALHVQAGGSGLLNKPDQLSTLPFTVPNGTAAWCRRSCLVLGKSPTAGNNPHPAQLVRHLNLVLDCASKKARPLQMAEGRSPHRKGGSHAALYHSRSK